ncbi:MAG: hypothetical protein JWN45_3030 [Acidobacteriaceae bacterium]|nr:hypothetical protein [Acidobacteriaceae bacterium]
MAKAPSPITITVTPTFQHNAQITFTNYTRISHVNNDVFLDVGMLDDQLLIEKIRSGGGSIEVPGYVISRFGMTITTLLQLQTNVNEAVEQARANGLIPEAVSVRK